MTTGIRSSADGSKSYISIGGTDRVTIDGATGAVSFFNDVTFSGLASRIKGDFSNATVSSRLMFQSSVANGVTAVSTIPNGTATVSAIAALNSSDPNNSSFTQILSGATEARIDSGARGSASFLPLLFVVGGSARMRIDAATGEILNVSPAGLGYGPGAGGTVTQATSKSTAVTLNKPSGEITMNAANLVAGGAVAFTLNNSLIGPYDTVQMNLGGGASVYTNYEVRCAGVGAGGGAATVFVKNLSAGNVAEALILNFTIIKGATS